MKIDAIANYNYAHNNNINLKSKNVNFGVMLVTPDVYNTMKENLILGEANAMTETANDVFSINDVVKNYKEDPYYLGRMKEYVRLQNLLSDSNGNIRLQYEQPFKDFRFSSTNGISAVQSLHYSALGGVFNFCNFVPSLPQNADNEFVWRIEGICSPLKVKFMDGNSSRVKVYAEEHGHMSDRAVATTLEQFNFIPNIECPVPTKGFIRSLVSNVYNHLIKQNVSNMTNIDKELTALRREYVAKQLGKFVRVSI